MHAWAAIVPHVRRDFTINFDKLGIDTTLIIRKSKASLKALADSVGSDIARESQSFPLIFTQLEEKDTRPNAPFADGYSTRYSEIINCCIKRNITHIKMKQLAILLTIGLVTHQANAAITITNFNLKTTSVTFDISGTMPSPLPASNRNALYFVNPIPATNPGFALGSFMSSSSPSFTGLQTLRTSPNPVATGGISFGDYFFVSFANNLATGETVSGTLTATWSSTAFDPSAIGFLNVFWGTGSSDIVNTGTLLTTAAPVPEPSAALLAALGSFPLLSRSRKR